MILLDLFWITEARAADLGFTHHGKLYGLPAFVRVERNGVDQGCPKVGALCLLTGLFDLMADAFCAAAGDFVPCSPLQVGRPIVIAELHA